MNPANLVLHHGPDIPDCPIAEALPSPGETSPPGERPDARLFLKSPGKDLIAHAALWWTETPELNGRKVGCIGGFAAADGDSAKRLLEGALEHLRKAGCETAVGPMNGSTWRRYRFVVESDGRGPFLLEPRNPPIYPDWWRRAGFSELARYSSSIVDLRDDAASPPGLARRLERSGVVIRGLNPDRYDDELRAIHAVSLKSFPKNLLYTPLDEESFLNSYQKVRGRADPRLVRIAERDGVPCGFVFAISDLESEARGEKPAVIVKTLAVDPGSRSAGLGSLLVDEVHAAAAEMGFTQAIHALQHETNTSLKITARNRGSVFRRYALFVHEL